MLSELRPGQRRTVSEAEQGRTTLWRAFEASFTAARLNRWRFAVQIGFSKT